MGGGLLVTLVLEGRNRIPKENWLVSTSGFD